VRAATHESCPARWEEGWEDQKWHGEERSQEAEDSSESKEESNVSGKEWLKNSAP